MLVNLCPHPIRIYGWQVPDQFALGDHEPHLVVEPSVTVARIGQIDLGTSTCATARRRWSTSSSSTPTAFRLGRTEAAPSGRTRPPGIQAIRWWPRRELEIVADRRHGDAWIEVMLQSYAINHYDVSLVSSRPSAQDPVIAHITLYEGTSTRRGLALFYPDGVELEPPVVTSYKIILYYHAAQFGAVLELLREESPIWLYAGGSTAYLTTKEEPVGEEEGGAG